MVERESIRLKSGYGDADPWMSINSDVLFVVIVWRESIFEKLSLKETV